MPTVLMAYGLTPASPFTPRQHAKMCKDIRKWAKTGTAQIYLVTFSIIPPPITSVTCIFDSQTPINNAQDRLTLTHGTYTVNGGQNTPWRRTYSHGGGTELKKTLYNLLSTWGTDTISSYSETFIYLISESVRFEAIRRLCSNWYRSSKAPDGPAAAAFLSALVTNNKKIRNRIARKDKYDELTIQECLDYFAPVTSSSAPGITDANAVRSGMQAYLSEYCK